MEHVAVAVRHVRLHVVDAFEHLEPATADQRVAASIGGFLEHHHIQALLGRGDGGGHAGTTSAAHHEICLDLLGLIRLLRRCGLLQRRSVSVRLVDATSHALDDGPYSSAWRPPRCLRSSSAAPRSAAAPAREPGH